MKKNACIEFTLSSCYSTCFLQFSRQRVFPWSSHLRPDYRPTPQNETISSFVSAQESSVAHPVKCVAKKALTSRSWVLMHFPLLLWRPFLSSGLPHHSMPKDYQTNFLATCCYLGAFCANYLHFACKQIAKAPRGFFYTQLSCHCLPQELLTSTASGINWSSPSRRESPSCAPGYC